MLVHLEMLAQLVLLAHSNVEPFKHAKVEGDLIPWDVQVFAYSGYTFGFRLKQGNVGNIPETIQID